MFRVRPNRWLRSPGPERIASAYPPLCRRAATMLLSRSPPHGPYDVRFVLLGIPVRVVPWFWVVAALLGWNTARGDPEGPLLVLALWVGCLLFSIVLHEMGHALAFRYYGISSHIELYHFGGLAIPDGAYWGGPRRTRGRWHHVVISAAGPLAQLLFAAALAAVVLSAGYAVPLAPWLFGWLHWLGVPLEWLLPVPAVAAGAGLEFIPNPYLYKTISFLMYVNIAWALFNLLPIFPLDGGQIARETCSQLNAYSGLRQSLVLSLVVAAGMAVWNMYSQDQLGTIMFASLAFGNAQELKSLAGPWGRGGW